LLVRIGVCRNTYDCWITTLDDTADILFRYGITWDIPEVVHRNGGRTSDTGSL
jgi:hypothetical protein